MWKSKWYLVLVVALVACNGSVLVPNKKPKPPHGGGGNPGDQDPDFDPNSSPETSPNGGGNNGGGGKGKGKNKNRPDHNRDWDDVPVSGDDDLDKGGRYDRDHDRDRDGKGRRDNGFPAPFTKHALESKQMKSIPSFRRVLNRDGLKTLQHRGIVELTIENLETGERVDYASEPTIVSYRDNPDGELQLTKLMPVSGRHGSKSRYRDPIYLEGYFVPTNRPLYGSGSTGEWRFSITDKNERSLGHFSSMRF